MASIRRESGIVWQCQLSESGMKASSQLAKKQWQRLMKAQ